MKQQINDEKIWTNAKQRFLAEEANLWILGNRIFLFLMVIGIITLFFQGWPKYVGIVLVSFSIGNLVRRNGLYEGYFDGYECGYMDCGFSLVKILKELKENESASIWASLPDGPPLPKAYTLDELLDAIGWSQKDKKDYDKMIYNGLGNLGFSLKYKKSPK